MFLFGYESLCKVVLKNLYFFLGDVKEDMDIDVVRLRLISVWKLGLWKYLSLLLVGFLRSFWEVVV